MRLIIDLDSTEEPVQGKQECVAYNGDCLGAKLRPGNVHSADGALDFITRFVERYRPWFKHFFGCVAMLPLPTQRSTSIAKISGARTSTDYRLIES